MFKLFPALFGLFMGLALYLFMMFQPVPYTAPAQPISKNLTPYNYCTTPGCIYVGVNYGEQQLVNADHLQHGDNPDLQKTVYAIYFQGSR